MAGTPLLLRPLAHYADFQGRSRRAEFWLFNILVFVVINAIWAWLLLPLLPMLKGSQPDTNLLLSRAPFFMVMVLVGLALYIPMLALRVRRLHDSNRTGWWAALPYAANTVGQSLVYMFQGKDLMAVSQAMQSQMQTQMTSGAFSPASIFMLELPVFRITLPYTLATVGVASLVLLTFFVWPGTRGANRFGADPRAG